MIQEAEQADAPEESTEEPAITPEESVETPEKPVVTPEEPAVTQEEPAVTQEEPVADSNDVQNETVLIVEEQPEVHAPDPGATEDNDELFAGYVQSVMYEGIKEKLPEADDGFVTAPALRSLVPRRETLTANEKKLYDLLKVKITQVASGQLDDTEFLFSPADIVGKTTFTPSDLGLTSFSNSEATQAALRNLFGDFSAVVTALKIDLPYEMYWFDKTSGWGSRAYGGYSGHSSQITLTGNTEITMRVAAAYSKTGTKGTTMADTAKTGAASAARANAEAIVTRHASKTDYEKMKAYRDAICAAVEYNFAALASGTPYGDPWQLIYVFDNDPTTDVVCEGYSKAFQLLCDLSTFQSSQVDCISVSGRMQGGTGAGGHMWNVITMEDGENYIADVTNSDDGAKGNFRLFMRGAPSGTDLIYTIEGVSYTYYDGSSEGHDNVVAMYPASKRELSKYDYYSEVLTDPGYLYALDVLPFSVTFDDVVFASGYESQSRQIQIINRGTDTLTNLTVYLLGENPDGFYLADDYLSLNDLPVNYATQFSVSTRQYLDKKTYNATAVIYTNSTPIATIPLSFTVKSNVSPDTKYDLRFIGTINDLDSRNTFKMAAIPESEFKQFHIVFEDRAEYPQAYDVRNRSELARRLGLNDDQYDAFSADCVRYEVLKRDANGNFVAVSDEESPLILQPAVNGNEELCVYIKKKATRSDGPFYFRITFDYPEYIYDQKNTLLYELENDPTVYCDTKEEAYAAIREIIRNRTNNMSRYTDVRNYRNYDAGGYVYERIYVNDEAFKTASGTATAISMEDVCDFTSERDGMQPYEGDYMFNLIGNRVKEAFTYEAPSVFGENDESMGISTEHDPVTDTYSTYDVFEVYLPVITTLAEEQAVDAKVQSLLNNEFASVKNSTSNTEKINAIYNYITSHVSGTVSGGGGSNRKWPQYHTAYHALIKGNGTCESFAQLFTRLSREMGVASKVIMGVDASAHTYNIVDGGDGYWYFIDCSAGIGLTEGDKFPRAAEQERYTRPRYIINYWNKIKGGTNNHVDTIKVLDRNGEECFVALNEDEATDYLLNELAKDPVATFTIRFDSDWMLDLYQGYRFGDDASRVSIDLNGHKLVCKNQTVFGVNEIRNGTIQVGYKDKIMTYAGSVMFEGDIRIEDVSFTKGTGRDFVIFDLNEFYGTPEIVLDDVRFNNLYVNMIHSELLASEPQYAPSVATYSVTLRNTVTLNGCYFNLMNHSATGHPVIHLEKIPAEGENAGSLAKLVFNGTNTIGSVMWPKGPSASLSYGVCKPIEFVPVNSSNTEVNFASHDVIAINNGTLKKVTSTRGATGNISLSGITDITQTLSHKAVDDTALEIKLVGKELRFAKPSYQITFNANGGSFAKAADAKKTVMADDPYGTLPVPVRTGYTFKGWYSAAVGGDAVHAETQMTTYAAHTLYAQWELATYTVSLDTKGGTIAPSQDSLTVTFGEKYEGIPAQAERDGYIFLGWYMSEGGGTKVENGMNLVVNEDHTLYAVWKETYPVAAPTAAVTYNGDVRDGSQSVEPGSKVSLYSETNGAEIYYKEFSGSVSDADEAAFTGLVKEVREKVKNREELSDEEKKLRFEDAIEITSDVTLLTIAVKDDHTDSEIRSFGFTIKDMSDTWGDLVDAGDNRAFTDTNGFGDLNEDGNIDAFDVPEELWATGIEDYDYDGTAKTQPLMRVYHGKKLLTAGTDYTVTYTNNKNAGTATVTITGKKSYTGTIKKEFTIRPLDIADAATVM
ncbi:MAG: InlB B-repeat-containing protein, partial [Lachnospiraceae bacterium]|nr:InlB B-repeat-containing protein [Lachnospiraceae bacterium]